MQVADDDLVVLDVVHDVDEHGRYAEDVRAFVANNRVDGGLHVVTVVGHHCGQRKCGARESERLVEVFKCIGDLVRL